MFVVTLYILLNTHMKILYRLVHVSKKEKLCQKYKCSNNNVFMAESQQELISCCSAYFLNKKYVGCYGHDVLSQAHMVKTSPQQINIHTCTCSSERQLVQRIESIIGGNEIAVQPYRISGHQGVILHTVPRNVMHLTR